MSLKFFTPKHALEFYTPDETQSLDIVLAQTGISAGFPSPADDFRDNKISLDRVLVKNKEATFYAKVSGQSMIGAGLDDGDLLVVDKSLEPEHNKIAVCFIDGEFTVKRLQVTKEGVFLLPANPAYEPIQVTEDNNFQIWGIVTHVIKRM
ncbi:SOS-response transcriptional regulator UmuD-like protein [Aquaticitalea lipolytica]|jgi:DNA polymerase V|uniref:SOS-response transcriptional regulator UmuD-like protein n=1 Tax=Aquaticitalea lipolytica TaxID=1247562 RepID=A0A8J2XJB0_9FLAO|nr:translesion error-prone DNA polymerase V autoproteolytic subunit [Aquaticitalea lipolytica]GFZ91031.1 SOS-response transcriptional regulator UmuD-like protein [Aquaticitalea lipolytica]